MDRLLTQVEADALLAMEKRCDVAQTLRFPAPGDRLVVPVESADGREKFLLDVSRGRIKIAQCSFQERVRISIILARVDIEGPEHTNPDGEVIPCPHLHVYREGFGDKWAASLPPIFSRPENLLATLGHFCQFCNITQLPLLQGALE